MVKDNEVFTHLFTKMMKSIPFFIYTSLCVSSFWLLPVNFSIYDWDINIDFRLFLILNTFNFALFLGFSMSTFLFFEFTYGKKIIINEYEKIVVYDIFSNLTLVFYMFLCNFILLLFFVIAKFQINANTFMGFFISVPLYSITITLFYCIVYIIRRGVNDEEESDEFNKSEEPIWMHR